MFDLYLISAGDNSQEAFETYKFRLGDTIKNGTKYLVPLVLNNTVDREEVRDRTKTLYLGIMVLNYSCIDSVQDLLR